MYILCFELNKENAIVGYAFSILGKNIVSLSQMNAVVKSENQKIFL